MGVGPKWRIEMGVRSRLRFLGVAAVAIATLGQPTGRSGGIHAQVPPPGDTVPKDTVPHDSLTFRLDPVVVTATRTDATTSELAVAVSVVGRAHLVEQPARLLLDALVGEPGILIQQTTAGQGAAIVRALTGSHVLLMVDGVRLNNGTFRQGPSHYLATVDPETVERIEVVRGAASALYGSDAIGGVVNVITRRSANLLDPSERSAVQGSYTYDGATRGSRVRITGAAALPGVLRGLEVSGGGSYSTQGDLEPGGGNPRQEPTGFDHWGGDLRFDLRATPRLAFDLSLNRFEQESVPRYDRYVDFRSPSVPEGGFGRSARYVFDPQDRSLIRLRSRSLWNGSWLSSLSITVSYQNQTEGRSIQSQSVEDGVVVPSSRLEYRFDGVRSLAADVQAQALAADDSRSLTYGLEAWDNRTDSRGWVEDLTTGDRTPEYRLSGGVRVPTGRFPDDSRFRGLGAYALLDQKLREAVRLQVGGRWSGYWLSSRVGDEFGGDVHSRSTDLSGEVGLVWSALPDLDLRARFAQAFRAPNIYDLTLVGDVPGGVALPNPNIQPEQSYTLEAGATLRRGGSRLDLTAYRLRIDGLIDRVSGSFRGDTLFGPDSLRVLLVDNVGDATVHGLEASLTLPLPGEGTLRASAFLTRGDAKVVRDGELIEEPLSRVPPPTLSSRARWPLTFFDREAWIEYFMVAAGEQTRLGFRDELDSRIQEGGTPGYHVHSVRVGTQAHEAFSVTAGIENIFDELYRIHGSGIDGAGRHLYFRLDVRP
jgi:outer membrane receptor protein involved in Fe transport